MRFGSPRCAGSASNGASMDGSTVYKVSMRPSEPVRDGSIEAFGLIDGPDDHEWTRNGAAEVAAFDYAETRVIEVEPETLVAKRVITGRGQDHITRAYKLLRTQVLQRLARNRWQTIAVVSPSAGDGKTLTAVNLAIS